MGLNLRKWAKRGQPACSDNSRQSKQSKDVPGACAYAGGCLCRMGGQERQSPRRHQRKELQLPALAYEQKLKEPYAALEIVRNGITFGDMPVWEMRFVTKVMYEVEIAEELCEEQ